MRRRRMRFGHASDRGKVAGYKLGLVSGRQQYTEYSWPQAVKMAEKESGSSNGLRVEIRILHWGADGQQLPAIAWPDPKDVRGALRKAKELVLSGEHMAEVRGEASRLYAMKGFGDRAVFYLGGFDYESPEGNPQLDFLPLHGKKK